MTHSCFTAPLFHVAVGNQRRLASLKAILTDPTIERFDYPLSAMNNLAILFAIGLTKALLIEHDQSLDVEQWSALTTGEALTPSYLFSRFPAGFELYGDIALMQFPAQLFSTEQEALPIDGLFHPFLSSGKEASLLQQDRRLIRRVCSSCAMMALYGQHTLSNAVAHYWSVAQTSASLITTLVLPGKPLARSIWLNQLLSQSDQGGVVNALPWVPDTTGQRGLNRDGSLPFEPWLRRPCRLKHPLALYFPLIRCLRLEHQTVEHQGEQCELCRSEIGIGDMAVTGYRILGEKTLFTRLKPDTRDAMVQTVQPSQQAIGIKDKASVCSAVDFKRLYEPAARHPQLLYQTPDKRSYPVAVKVSDCATTVIRRRPAWAWLLTVEPGNRPAVLWLLSNQPAAIDDQVTGTGIEQLKARLVIALFGVQFKKGQEPDGIIHTTLRFADIEGALSDVDQKNQAGYAALIIDLVERAIIPALIEATKILTSRYPLDSAGTPQRLKAVAKKVPVEQPSPELLAYADALWQMAYHEIITISQCTEWDQKEILTRNGVEALEARTRNLWNALLQQQPPDYPLPAARMIESRACAAFDRKLKQRVKKRSQKP